MREKAMLRTGRSFAKVEIAAHNVGVVLYHTLWSRGTPYFCLFVCLFLSKFKFILLQRTRSLTMFSALVNLLPLYHFTSYSLCHIS